MSDRTFQPPRIGNANVDDILFRRKRSSLTNILRLGRNGAFVSRDIAIFVDGACLGNGTEWASGGMGVYFGPDSRHNISQSLSGRQTNQRAEIRAAILALRKVKKLLNNEELDTEVVVLASDSAYLVDAMTRHVERWRCNGWMNSKRGEVANKLDLRILDNLIDELKDEYGVYVKLWKVDREDNEEADELAKGAAGYYDDLDSD